MVELIKTYPDYSHYNVNVEVDNLKKYLQTADLTVDPEIFKKIDQGDIIEIYSFPENIQIYSNSEFRKLCSYTAEQMNSIPFPKLFWRDDEVHLTLMRKAALLCDVEKKMCPWDFPNHELVEALHPKKRTFNMHLKWLVPCFKSGTDIVVAWITTCQVEFIYELPE